ncbi:MAG: peptidylprolyl isomerase [Armatimonadetes bacterium]|nr:peptidylprolyl isomerase [Armatimonadota bacterium]
MFRNPLSRLVVGLCLTVLLLAACRHQGPRQASSETEPPPPNQLKYKKGDRPVVPEDKVVITLKTTRGTFKIRLHPEDAPVSCDNFVKLTESGFYNGTIFHRVIPGFVAQGGDPTGTGAGGPGWRIPFEDSPRKHLLGSVGMARSQEKDSAGSQFYVCLAPQPGLDGNYVIFGEVIEGMDVVQKIQPTENRGTGPVPASVERDKILEAVAGSK